MLKRERGKGRWRRWRKKADHQASSSISSTSDRYRKLIEISQVDRDRILKKAFASDIPCDQSQYVSRRAHTSQRENISHEIVVLTSDSRNTYDKLY